MAQITRYPWVRHLRSEPSSHILAYRNGELKRRGRGLAFWFRPMGAAVAEVPIDNRDQQFIFHARSADYQDLAIQGVVTYRVDEAEKLASRLDVVSELNEGGIVFGDGVESDSLRFDWGMNLRVGVSKRRLELVAA